VAKARCNNVPLQRYIATWLPRYCNHTDPRCSNVPFQRGGNYSVTWRPRGYHVHLLAGLKDA